VIVVGILVARSRRFGTRLVWRPPTAGPAIRAASTRFSGSRGRCSRRALRLRVPSAPGASDPASPRRHACRLDNLACLDRRKRAF